MAEGISNQGRESERLFLGLVQGSRAVGSASSGDAEVCVDGIYTAVEVKKCDAASESGTINQVRAVKFIPLVVFNPARNCWYVVPATELVRLAASKARGQHTEIPFESMNLGLRRLIEWKCQPECLDESIRKAIRFDRQYPEVKQAMSELLSRLKQCSSEFKAEITTILKCVPSWTIV